MEEYSEEQNNHSLDVIKLTSFLQEYLNNKQTFTKAIQINKFVHGQSNPTYLINYEDKKVVLRKKPAGKLLKGAHWIEREFRVLKALHSVNFPVPRPILLWEDSSVIGTPFYLMDYVEGRIFRDFRLSFLSPEERGEVWEEYIRVIALLQSYTPQQLGLEDYGKGNNYFQRLISTWTAAYQQSETEKIREMDYLIDWLPKNTPSEEHMGTSLVHGDLRLDNVVFHPTENKIIAVLDWELSTLGPQIVDVSYTMQMYYSPSSFLGLGNFDKGFSGIPSETAFKLKFCQKAGIKEPSQSDWFFYISANLFKMAGITQGVYKRSLQGNASSRSADSYLKVTKSVAKWSYDLSVKSSVWKSKENRINLLKSNNSMFKFLADKLSPRFYEVYLDVEDFMDRHVYPLEREFTNALNSKSGGERWKMDPEFGHFKILESLKAEAKKQNLWNLFLPEVSKLSNLDYALICQIMGRSIFFAPEVFNCSAPDTGNMEVLFRYGSAWQKSTYLTPLLEGKVRSCFAMTEKGVASSDATNISATIERDPGDKDYYIVNGRKWWISGAGDPRCEFIIFMGKNQNKTKSNSHSSHTMILIPLKTEGVTILRPMKVFGYDDAPHGHMDMLFRNVRVHKDSVILGEGRGFEIAQGRLGPGRIHHCMRIFGTAERAMENICDRVATRKVFGKNLSENDEVIKQIAKCQTALVEARLLVLYAAHQIDLSGAKGAKEEIAMIKVVAPNVGLKILDQAIQLHGAEGVSQDTFLAYAWAAVRTLRIADGPDEVHLRSIGKSILTKYTSPKF